MRHPLFSALLGTVLLLSARGTFAAEIRLAEVTSSYPQGYRGTLNATLSGDSEIPTRESELEGIVYADSRGTRLTFTLEELRKGAVLIRALGKDLLKLKAPEMDAREGGGVDLVFYRKFFSEDQRRLRFDLVEAPEPETRFLIQTDDPAGRTPFDRIHVKLESGFVPSGVERIELFAGGAPVRKYDPTQLPKVRRHQKRSR